MSRFSGPQPGYKGSGNNKGIMRQWREKLRREASDRNEKFRKAKEEADDSTEAG